MRCPTWLRTTRNWGRAFVADDGFHVGRRLRAKKREARGFPFSSDYRAHYWRVVSIWISGSSTCGGSGLRSRGTRTGGAALAAASWAARSFSGSVAARVKPAEPSSSFRSATGAGAGAATGAGGKRGSWRWCSEQPALALAATDRRCLGDTGAGRRRLPPARSALRPAGHDALARQLARQATGVRSDRLGRDWRCGGHFRRERQVPAQLHDRRFDAATGCFGAQPALQLRRQRLGDWCRQPTRRGFGRRRHHVLRHRYRLLRQQFPGRRPG